MRNRGAAARAYTDLAAAAGSVQRAHALHLPRIPDLLQRLRAYVAHGRAIQHVALAARVHVAVLFHIHGAAPEIVARVLPFVGGMARVRAHQVGLVFLDAYLVHARSRVPERQEVVYLPRVAFHLDHLHHHLQFGPALVLQAGEAHEIVAYFFELRALAVELE